jgi:hypothetical protein
MKKSAAILLTACAALSAAPFKEQTIDNEIQIGYGLAIADVNGDAKPDVLLADKAQVVWYENPGWEKHVMTDKLTPLDHVCIAAQDIDGDGKAEVAVGAGWNPGDTVNSGAVFYLIPPADRKQKWNPVQLPHEPTVHRMWWVRGDAAGRYNLIVSPLHGRGNKNGAGEGVRLLEYLVPSNPATEWKTRLVDDSMHMTHNLDPVQWDSDPAQELLYAGKEGVQLLDPKAGEWQKTSLVSTATQEGFPGAGEVRLGKLKENRFIATIEPMHGTNAVFYSESSGWKRQVLDSSLADGHAVATGDFFHKGLDQIVIGWRGKNAAGKFGIKLLEPNDSDATAWTPTWVDDNGMACEDLKAADLNGDGWLDIIAAGRATKNVKIYWNQGR